jgi:isoquinoline 1-oxidoreductase subunit alpha
MPSVQTITFRLNAEMVTAKADPEMPLLWFLRDEQGLLGTRYGCGRGFCGACTVHLDGMPARACQIPLGAIGNSEVTTIEGVIGKVASLVRKCWQEHDVAQCGYCQSGQLMAAIALLEKLKKPTDAELDEAMTGNICRCNTYHRIKAAVRDAAGRLASFNEN